MREKQHPLFSRPSSATAAADKQSPKIRMESSSEPLLGGFRSGFPLPTPSAPRVVANPLVSGTAPYYPYEASETFDCRICGSGQVEKCDPLIAPCDCAGGLSLVHKKCLLRWIELRPQQHIRVNLLTGGGGGGGGGGVGGQPAPNNNNNNNNSQTAALRAAALQNNLLLSGGAVPSLSNDSSGNPLTNPRLQCEICLSPYRIVLVPRFVCSAETLCKCRTVGYALEGALLVCCVALTVVLMFLVAPTLGNGGEDNGGGGNPCGGGNATTGTAADGEHPTSFWGVDCDDDGPPPPPSTSSPSSLITIWTLFGVTVVISAFALRKIVLRFLRSASVLELEGVGDSTNFPFGRPAASASASSASSYSAASWGAAPSAGGGSGGWRVGGPTSVPGGVDPDSSVAGLLITEGDEEETDDEEGGGGALDNSFPGQHPTDQTQPRNSLGWDRFHSIIDEV